MSEPSEESTPDDFAPTTSIVDIVARAAVSAIPVVGGPLEIIYVGLRDRQAAKAAELMAGVVEAAGQERLLLRVNEDPYFAALFYNAVNTGLRTGMASKRRLLIEAVSQAALDDAKLDESQLIVDALAAIDVPHALALARLADEWAAVQIAPTNSSQWGGSDVWDGLAEPIQAALVMAGAAKPPRFTFVRADHARRQVGISDFGLKLIESLRAAGLDDERRTSSSS